MSKGVSSCLRTAALLALGEILVALVAGDRPRARAVMGAWRWNARRRSEIKVQRKYYKLTKVDKSIHAAGSRGQVVDELVGVAVAKEKLTLPLVAGIIPLDDDFYSAVSRDTVLHPSLRGFSFHFKT